MTSVKLGVRVTVSGSFRRFINSVQRSVSVFTEAGAHVLSPADPRIVDHFGDFLFVASDRLRVIRSVQDRHLSAIRASDFVWVVCPDGYVGPSAAMEIGLAYALGVPVFGCTPPLDLTLRQYVRTVRDEVAAISAALREPRNPSTVPSLLVDPDAAADHTHARVEQARALLIAPSTAYSDDLPELRTAVAEVQEFGRLSGQMGTRTR